MYEHAEAEDSGPAPHVPMKTVDLAFPLCAGPVAGMEIYVLYPRCRGDGSRGGWREMRKGHGCFSRIEDGGDISLFRSLFKYPLLPDLGSLSPTYGMTFDSVWWMGALPAAIVVVRRVKLGQVFLPTYLGMLLLSVRYIHV